MGLQHFSHEHPLILDEEHKHDGEKVRWCDGCRELILGPSYSCSKCNFYLHKLCAELPREMEHPMHPEHPLTLLANPSYRSSTCGCDVCGQQDWKNFTYHCSLCKFDIDIICASLMGRKIEHASHKHPLTPLRKPALFLCDACGTKHEGNFYLCLTCIPFGVHFWIHRDCASLPGTIKQTDHDHTLTLAYSIPPEYSKFVSYCGICAKKLNRLRWIYYCAECRYFAHVNCATSKMEPFMLILFPDRKTKIKVEDLEPNLNHLPVPDESVSLISHFSKKTSLEENNRPIYQLNHFCHDHPLILFGVQSKDESCSRSELSSPNETKNDKICDGCTQPILASPFYSCTQCNFFLHKSCAELPTEVQHPCHPEHPLILHPKSSEFFGLFKCKVCYRYCNGFLFSCACCRFYLDVNCASLPGAITHEAHGHHLLILREKSDGRCNSCNGELDGFTFGCDTCDFKLHTNCALLPRTIRHRYDTHPLTLTYSPAADYLDEYYCEICENELNPKWWFYYCGGCKQSFHKGCIHRGYAYSNLKFGDTLKVDSHPHPLTFVRKAEGNSQCNYCGEAFYIYYDYYTAFKCSQCNFMLHQSCASSRSRQNS